MLKVGRVMIGLVGAAIIAVGVRFLLDPAAAASGYGLSAGADDPYLLVKGVRDIASGLIVWTLLLSGANRALAWATLAASFIPVGDMLIVLHSGGAATIAFGVHGATAAFMVAAATLMWRGYERP